MWLLLALQLSAHTTEFALGPWMTQDRQAIVEMAPCVADTAHLCGTIIRLTSPGDQAALDNFNPDPRLRKKTVLGLTILSGFILNPTDARCPWQSGKAYDPDSGKVYHDIELCAKDADHMVLTKELRLGPFKSGVSGEVWSRAAK